MPSRRRSRLRAAVRRPSATTIPGVPVASSRALDRLDLSELTSAHVAQALKGWERTTSLSRAELSAPHNDWTEFIAPGERGVLEEALNALPPRHAAPLRAVVDRADEQFAAKTLPNPMVDPSQPWWARRWWH